MRWLASRRPIFDKIGWWIFWIGCAGSIMGAIKEGAYGVILAAILVGVVFMVTLESHKEPK
jgi:hypothetical protein